MKTGLLTAAMLLGYALGVGAQTTTPELPTSYDVLQFAGGLDPITSVPTLLTAGVIATCNLTPTAGTPPANPTNPTILEFDDPGNVGKSCRLTRPLVNMNGTGFRVIIVANGPSGRSDVSNIAGPFVLSAIPGRPAAPTKLVVR